MHSTSTDHPTDVIMTESTGTSDPASSEDPPPSEDPPSSEEGTESSTDIPVAVESEDSSDPPSSSTSEPRKRSPPPLYSETDVYTHDSVNKTLRDAGIILQDAVTRSSSTRSKRRSQAFGNASPPSPPGTPHLLKRTRAPTISGVKGMASTDFDQSLKGMIPMTMAGDDESTSSSDNPNAPYSIDTDPLLLDDSESSSKFFVGVLQSTVIGLAVRNRSLIWKVLTGIFLTGITIYLGFAVAYSPYGAIAPLVFVGLGLLAYTYTKIKQHFGKEIYDSAYVPFAAWWNRHWYIFKWFVYPAPLIGLVIYLTIMMTQIRQLQSVSGFIFFFSVIWLTSKHPNKVVWRPVIWGYSLQFLMGLLVLQWDYGYQAVEWLSGYVATIINFGYHGAAIIYGDPFMILHPFLMMGLSLLIYVGAVLSILYYFGVTQLMASKLAWGMATVMGTTAIETLGVAANIMLNGMDVMIMLRPYLMKLTVSEFNCFLVGNNATIAGFMFGILILYGAPPQHLLTAAVMSAPASIAIAKLNYPETTPEKSITKDIDKIKLSKGTERNMFEAAANGSSIAGRTVMTVCVNYISFMSILTFIDAGLNWAGNRVGFDELSFGFICSYVFFPIALLIGVDVSQCRPIANVIGLKVFTTEVYSYQVLGQMYEDGLIDDRSKALGTYALCGFCSLSTVAIAVGIWQIICPQRRPLMSRLMFRVMFQANISCFTTACVAGLFYSEKLSIFDGSANSSPGQSLIIWVLDQVPKLLG